MNAQTKIPDPYAGEELIGLPELLWYVIKDEKDYRLIRADYAPKNAVIGPCDTSAEALHSLHHYQEQEGSAKALGYVLTGAIALVSAFVGYWVAVLLMFGG